MVILRSHFLPSFEILIFRGEKKGKWDIFHTNSYTVVYLTSVLSFIFNNNNIFSLESQESFFDRYIFASSRIILSYFETYILPIFVCYITCIHFLLFYTNKNKIEA